MEADNSPYRGNDRELKEKFNKVEVLEERLSAEKARAESAEAACAELTDALARLVQIYEMDCEVDIRPEWVRHAISTSCGKDWLSPEKTKLAVEALEYVIHNLDDCCGTVEIAEKALAALKEGA